MCSKICKWPAVGIMKLLFKRLILKVEEEWLAIRWIVVGVTCHKCSMLLTSFLLTTSLLASLLLISLLPSAAEEFEILPFIRGRLLLDAGKLVANEPATVVSLSLESLSAEKLEILLCSRAKVRLKDFHKNASLSACNAHNGSGSSRRFLEVSTPSGRALIKQLGIHLNRGISLEQIEISTLMTRKIAAKDVSTVHAQRKVVVEDIATTNAWRKIFDEDVAAADASTNVERKTAAEDVAPANVYRKIVAEDTTSTNACRKIIAENETAADACRKIVVEDATTTNVPSLLGKMSSAGYCASTEKTPFAGKLASAEETPSAGKYVYIANEGILGLFGFETKVIGSNNVIKVEYGHAWFCS
ncbi:hypothetical protein COLO4_22774 [Corchorus olitorius]|uniref:Uncharacterized protein n=1 Tax=Corchorus olitorius TaxID=93759 RepID=A0A1R3IK07_9ROSI|nr:hypothetical protein COLO4_22774 [Corchorus olitorius]